MFRESDEMRVWADAMTDQTLHELECSPCCAFRVPVCAEGRQLQLTARAAHEQWVSAEYAGLAEAP